MVPEEGGGYRVGRVHTQVCLPMRSVSCNTLQLVITCYQCMHNGALKNSKYKQINFCSSVL